MLYREVIIISKLNKKGQGISLNFLIIAALALIALIIIALFFTGGITKIFGKKAAVAKASQQEIALAEANCQFWCSTGIKSSFLNPSFSQELVASGYEHCGKFTKFGPESSAETAWNKFCGECVKADEKTTNPCSSKTDSVSCGQLSGCKWEAKK